MPNSNIVVNIIHIPFTKRSVIWVSGKMKQSIQIVKLKV